MENEKAELNSTIESNNNENKETRKPHNIFDGTINPSDLLSNYTGRNTLCYYTTFMQLSGSNDSIERQDVFYISSLCQQMDPEKGLDILIESPGGSVTDTEAIVDYLYSRFKDRDIRVIIPNATFSAGTLWALSAHTILMPEAATLGPIDPQIILCAEDGIATSVSAFNVYRAFNAAKDDMAQKLQNKDFWEIQLKKYPPSAYLIAKDAIRMTGELATKWLTENMFASFSDKNDRAGKVVRNLNRNNGAHDRRYNYAKCRDMGLNIELIKDTDEMFRLFMLAERILLSLCLKERLCKIITGPNNLSCNIKNRYAFHQQQINSENEGICV